MNRMGGSCSMQRTSSSRHRYPREHPRDQTKKRSLQHSVESEVPDGSIHALYPVHDNYIRVGANRRSPKSLFDLCIESVCRSLPELDGELPPNLPQDLVDAIANSLVTRAALNATTLRALKNCELGELSLAGCRGVKDEWLRPLGSSFRESSGRSLGSGDSHETFLTARSGPEAPSVASTLSLLDLRGSRRLTDRGLLQLSELSALSVAKLDDCHGLTGRGLLAFACCENLWTLSLANCRGLTDEAIVNISHLRLRALNLDGCRCLTDWAVEAISSMKDLRMLDLSQCDLITDDGLTRLSGCPYIEELSLGWCRRITDKGVKVLCSQPGRRENLKVLRLARINITDDGVGHLAMLASLGELDLNGCSGMTGEALGDTLEKLRDLTTLDVSYCPQILSTSWQGKIDLVKSLDFSFSSVEDRHLARFSQLPNLQELNLDSCLVGDWAIGVLANNDAMPNLTTLDLADTDLTDLGMACLPNFQRLTKLSLFYCNITNNGLKHLQKMKSLEVLNLDSREIGDDGLAYLSGLDQLTSLDIFSGRITNTGCLHLSKIRSLQNLELCGGGVGDLGCAHLALLDNLTCLNLSQNERITNRGAAALAALGNLRALNLSNTRVNSAALRYLGGLVKLQSLALYGCRGVEDEASVRLLRDELPSLKCLRLNREEEIRESEGEDSVSSGEVDFISEVDENSVAFDENFEEDEEDAGYVSVEDYLSTDSSQSGDISW